MARCGLKRNGNRLRLFFIIACLFFSNTLFADITIDISSDIVSAGESVVIQIQVENARSVKPVGEPQLDKALIEFSGTMSSFQNINGKSSRSIILQYTVITKQEGVLVIPPIEFEADGVIHTSTPVTIRVEKAKQPTKRNTRRGHSLIDEMFFFEENSEPEFIPEKIMSSSTHFVGQPVIVRYFLMSDTPVSFGQYEWYNVDQRSDFIIFRSEEKIPGIKVNKGGKEYLRLHCGTWVLLPLRPGAYEIKNEIYHFEYLDKSSAFPVVRTHKVYYKPEKMQVLPYPSDAPAEFHGAVGNFSVSVSPEMLATTVDTPAVFDVTVSGNGNLYSLQSPPMPEIEGLQFIQLEKKESYQVSSNTLSGKITFRWQVIPSGQGDISVEGMRLCFLDPEDKKYKFSEAPHFNISVKSQVPDSLDDNENTQFPFQSRNMLLILCVAFGLPACIVLIFLLMVKRDKAAVLITQQKNRRNNNIKEKKRDFADDKERTGADYAFLCEMYRHQILSSFASGNEKEKLSSIEKTLKFLVREYSAQAGKKAQILSMADYIQKCRYGATSISDEILSEIRSDVVRMLNDRKQNYEKTS